MSKKVFVGNLPFKFRGRDLKELFSKYGEVEFATVILDRENRNRSKGFGFVTFVNDADADKAVSEMNEKEVEGRPLTVNEAKPREGFEEKSKEDVKESSEVADSGEQVSEVEKL